MRHYSAVDQWFSIGQRALQAVDGTPAHGAAPLPVTASGTQLPSNDAQKALTDAERRLSGGLMRVNHVGEVCAQALYEGQALATRNETLRQEYRRAAQEEGAHLDWTAKRLQELGARPSVLNPFWYAGAFTIGLLASRLGDRAGLGFMAETERQVEDHLEGHLAMLPPGDQRSRQIVSAMKDDEVRHAEFAMQSGGVELPGPVKWLMRRFAAVMTGTARYI